MKACKVCKIVKKLTCYYDAKGNADKKNTVCSECLCKKSKARNALISKKRFEEETRIYEERNKLHGYFLKTCKHHGNLTYAEIYLNIQHRNHKIHADARCIHCLQKHRKDFHGEHCYIENMKKGKIICYKCKLEKSANDFTHGQLNKRCSMCKDCTSKYNSKVSRRSRLKHIFGLTQEEYDLILEIQNNRCAVCKKLPNTINYKSNKLQPLSVDHCHKAEKEGKMIVRGFLCQNCNFGIGFFDDSIENLRNAIKYIQDDKINKLLQEKRFKEDLENHKQKLTSIFPKSPLPSLLAQDPQ